MVPRRRLPGPERSTLLKPLAVLLMAVALGVTLTPTQALAAELRQGDTVVVGANETIDDDLYAFGRSVNIRGTVNGDVIGAAADSTITGVVTGDLIVAGGTISVPGRVGGSIRAAGGNLTINGPVGEDVLAAGGNLGLGPDARVGRDVLLGAGSATMSGEVRRNVLAGTGDLSLDGTVGGDVRANVGALRLSERAVIGGNLAYTSDQEAQVAQAAVVRGTVARQVPEGARPEPGPADAAIGWLKTLVGLFALGLVFVLLFPGFSRRTVGTLRGSPWASLGLGLALLIGVPFAALLLFIVGLLVGGWWLALILLALYASALALAFTAAGLFVGDRILSRAGRPGLHLAWSLLLGLAILTLLALVPVVGGVAVTIALLFGLGALVLAAVYARRTTAGAAQRVGGEVEPGPALSSVAIPAPMHHTEVAARPDSRP